MYSLHWQMAELRWFQLYADWTQPNTSSAYAGGACPMCNASVKFCGPGVGEACVSTAASSATLLGGAMPRVIDARAGAVPWFG
jgi:hypothetical protein